MTPSPPRIHHQRWRTGPVLMGKMTISDKDCFTKVVPNDDTDIWTPSPGVRMPLIGGWRPLKPLTGCNRKFREKLNRLFSMSWTQRLEAILASKRLY